MYHALNLRRLAEVFAAANGKTLRQVGREAAGAHGFFYRLDNRRGCTFKTAERAQQYFEMHWPDGLEWPADIPRSVPARRKRPDARASELRP